MRACPTAQRDLPQSHRRVPLPMGRPHLCRRSIRHRNRAAARTFGSPRPPRRPRRQPDPRPTVIRGEQLLFFAVRSGLALIPPIALRYPIKKLAAGVTLLVLACYLLLSGAAIPTQRAFVMNGLVFGAIIIDRLRISMRVCAIAAAVVLVIEPASLVGVSFQMSFGAVVALIAVYETYGARLSRLLHSRSVSGKVLGYC